MTSTVLVSPEPVVTEATETPRIALQSPPLFSAPMARFQPQMRSRSDSWVQQQFQKAYLSSFNLALGELNWVPKTILEVGVGDGSFLAYLAQTFLGAEVSGVAFSSQDPPMKPCCGLHVLELHPSECLPFETGQFDLVVSHGLLSQTAMPRHWFKEMTRVSAEAVICSALMPLGVKGLKTVAKQDHWIPQLTGAPLLNHTTKPVTHNALQQWAANTGFQVESVKYPFPCHMALVRKQPKGMFALMTR